MVQLSIVLMGKEVFRNYDDFYEEFDSNVKKYPNLRSYPKRYRELCDCDYLFLSFPKSGRTWVRYFLARYIEAAFETMFSLEFTPHRSWDKRRAIIRTPTINFSHNFFDFFQDYPVTPFIMDQQICWTKNLIFLVRDPLSTLVSFYNQKVFREQVVKASLQDFILSKQYGIERHSKLVLAFFNLFNKSTAPKMLIQYEHLIASPQRFMDLVKFLFGDVNLKAFESAIENSKFNAMQRFELSVDAFSLTNGRMGSTKESPDRSMLKVREGKVKNYPEALSTDFIENILKLPYTSRLMSIMENI